MKNSIQYMCPKFSFRASSAYICNWRKCTTWERLFDLLAHDGPLSRGISSPAVMGSSVVGQIENAKKSLLKKLSDRVELDFSSQFTCEEVSLLQMLGFYGSEDVTEGAGV